MATDNPADADYVTAFNKRLFVRVRAQDAVAARTFMGDLGYGYGNFQLALVPGNGNGEPPITHYAAYWQADASTVTDLEALVDELPQTRYDEVDEASRVLLRTNHAGSNGNIGLVRSLSAHLSDHGVMQPISEFGD